MRNVSIALALIFASIVSGAAAQTPVPIPAGKTALADIGIYQVSYQSYGKDPVAMPPGWTGYFDAATGISYVPREQVLGRDAMFLHSPWRVPAGRTWIDFPVRLPEVQPITLELAIAMRPDIAVPDKSDGATFTCTIINEAGEHALLREHYALGIWKDHAFDLSAHAGKSISLRLQIEPGPANNPSFDHSYFGDATLVCGSGDGATMDIAELLDARARQAARGVSLVAAANDSESGVLPSRLLEGDNAIVREGETYSFRYDGPDCSVVYRYAPETGTLNDFTVSVDGGAPFLAAAGGGVTGAVKSGDAEDLAFLSGGSPASIEMSDDGQSLAVVWSYPLGERTVNVGWRFGIHGKALTVRAQCDDPVLSALSLGHVAQVSFRRPVTVPYLLGAVDYLAEQRVFVNRYLDWTVSHSSECPQGEAFYHSKTDGVRNPLLESGYIAVSPHFAEVLPNLPLPHSPWLDELGPRIVLDIWRHHDGTYAGDAENLRALKDNGVDHLAIISHVWQRYGYDVKLPDHLPANPAFGTEMDMKAFGEAANECGFLWSLHENYIDLYPDAPSYDPSARSLTADGAPSLGWYNAGTKVQSFGIKSNRAIGFAERNSPRIHDAYGTTAAYLDVHTCAPPWHQLDHDAAQPMAAMQLFKIEQQTALFQYERDVHGGPLFGEGHWQFYWAGLCDGVEGQVDGGEDHAPLLEFDLLKLHPQMVNHGMG